VPDKKDEDQLNLFPANYKYAKENTFLHATPRFRPIQKGRRKGGVSRVYTSSDRTKEVKINLWRELDIADQDLLLTIWAMANDKDRGLVVVANEKDIKSDAEKYIALRNALDLKDEALGMESISFTTTRYELLHEMGRTKSNASYKWMLDSLERLSGVRFNIDEGPEGEKIRYGFNLLSWTSEEKRHSEKQIVEEFTFFINPVSAAAMLVQEGGFTLTNRSERHSLKADDAKALHFALSGLVDPKSLRRLKVDNLCHRIWFSDENEEVKPGTLRARRAKLIEASREINLLPEWECLAEGEGKKSMLKVKRGSA